ncbi:alpha-1A adrenergic receptor [Patella vulgata]|uniref:alpha-1A adrenergic receptor n=1 Tax=Patella vulgata TaxID=6465 RepID=UPI00217F43A2|nr:alpha-1A adrenergic receptor [Patella vulgata]
MEPEVANTTVFQELNSTKESEIYLPAAIPVGMILGIIVCMTIGGNVLVLLAVYVNSHLRSTTNYFIVNLAIADLLLGTCVLPFSASLEVLDFWAFGQVFCDMWAAIDVLCCTASIMSLCVISIDRYIGVTRPLQHSSILTEKRAFYIIILIWLLAISISVAPLIGWKEPPDPNPMICSVTTNLGYVLFSVSGSFYIPLLIIIVVYIRIYREAVKNSRFLSTGVRTSKIDECEGVQLRIHTGRSSGQPVSPAPYQSSSSSEHSEGSGRKSASRMTLAGKIAKFKREKKAAKTLGIVVGVFILCWFPFFFVLPLGSLCPVCEIPEDLFKVIFWLGYCNSLMNPVIYACSSREFKRAFKRILTCQFRRRPRAFLNEQVERSSSNLDVSRCGPLSESVAAELKRQYTSLTTTSSLYMPRLTPLEQNSASPNQSPQPSPESPIHSLRMFQLKRRLNNESIRGISHQYEPIKGNGGLTMSSNKECEKSNGLSLSSHTDVIYNDHHFHSQMNLDGSFADDEEYVNSVIVNSRNHNNGNGTPLRSTYVPES